MSRSVAIGGLCIFALLFLWAAWWGWTDFRALRLEIAGCTTPLTVDQTSFWMMGMAGIAVLPFLSASADVRVHRVLFSLLIIWALGVPIISYMTLISDATAQGYPLPSGARVLLFAEFTLQAPACDA
ncbi:hypothetical protein [Roseinatronobacter alkalisoli]|uniref:DUF998 domain-containing protein n=1 Tax=Roseinatronobacter alkalisoli TaxID=3028235 RepID=A0ABT5TFC9_9RHOB|nr:hypothetical protein [Roseinatronobacter sp. HJB301]MDD7972872.1 hypothetical protein [Roseinatronobacter sp. HJB301]